MNTNHLIIYLEKNKWYRSKIWNVLAVVNNMINWPASHSSSNVATQPANSVYATASIKETQQSQIRTKKATVMRWSALSAKLLTIGMSMNLRKTNNYLIK